MHKYYTLFWYISCSSKLIINVLDNYLISKLRDFWCNFIILFLSTILLFIIYNICDFIIIKKKKTQNFMEKKPQKAPKKPK